MAERQSGISPPAAGWQFADYVEAVLHPTYHTSFLHETK